MCMLYLYSTKPKNWGGLLFISMSIFDICVFRHYKTSEVILILYLNEATEVALFTSFGMSIQAHISKGDKELENDE